MSVNIQVTASEAKKRAQSVKVWELSFGWGWTVQLDENHSTGGNAISENRAWEFVREAIAQPKVVPLKS